MSQDRQYRRLATDGDAALREDQTFGAIESYSGAIALRPDSMLAYLRRGETYERRGDLAAAARDFQTAATLAPTATRPLEELADIRFRQQRFRRAADLYARVLRVDDHSAAVSYKHALALYREGDLATAITALHQTLEIDSGLTEAHYLMGSSRQATPSRAPQPLNGRSRCRPASSAREELADLCAMLDRRTSQLEQLQIIAGLDPQRMRGSCLGRRARDRCRSAVPGPAALGARGPADHCGNRRVVDNMVQRCDRKSGQDRSPQARRVNPAVTSDVLTRGRAHLRSGQTEAASVFLRPGRAGRCRVVPDARGRAPRTPKGAQRADQLRPCSHQRPDEGNRAARIGDLSPINQPETRHLEAPQRRCPTI